MGFLTITAGGPNLGELSLASIRNSLQAERVVQARIERDRANLTLARAFPTRGQAAQEFSSRTLDNFWS